MIFVWDFARFVDGIFIVLPWCLAIGDASFHELSVQLLLNRISRYADEIVALY